MREFIFNPGILGPLYGLSEFGLLLWKRSGQGAKSADQGSLRLLWMVILASVALAVVVQMVVPEASSVLLEQLRTTGGALFLAGLALRWYAILYLGRLFTVNVAIAAEHPVIDSGPYRYVRHPSYVGALLAFLGIGITFANWLSLLMMVLPTSLAFMRRIRIEEAALSRALGEPYVRYMARTKRLLPGLY
jgi:protein-S-isoprenylcysteine O-methyltransferase